MTTFLWPIKDLISYKVIQMSDRSPYISQGFGENPQIYKQFGHEGHNGIDIAASTGTPVYAAHSGTVRYNKQTEGYGNYAEITDNKYKSVYAHMSKFEGVNRKVKKGDVIGYVGSTGFSTGPHLHFGIKPIPSSTNNSYGGSIDPMPLFKPMFPIKKVKVVIDNKPAYGVAVITPNMINITLAEDEAEWRSYSKTNPGYGVMTVNPDSKTNWDVDSVINL